MLKGRDYFIKQECSIENTQNNNDTIGVTKEELLLEQLESIAYECNEIESLKSM